MSFSDSATLPAPRPASAVAITSESDANEINRLHVELVGVAQDALQRAIEIGLLLDKQKAKLKHGEWMPWMEANLSFSTQTADRYRHVHRHREKFLTVGNLTLTEAYRIACPSSLKAGDDEKSGGTKITEREARELTDKIKGRLVEMEGFIAERLLVSRSVATSLLEVRDHKLYLDTHATFRDYCAEAWGLDWEIVEILLGLADGRTGGVKGKGE